MRYYLARMLWIFMAGTCFLAEGTLAQTVSPSTRVMALHTWQNNKKILQNANPNVTLNVSNMPLAKALRLIAQKASTGLYYNSKLVSGKKVTVHIKNMPLVKALQKVLEGTSLKAVTSGRNITIQKRKIRPVSLTNIPTKLSTVQESVSGTVTDAQTGDPLAGVNILVVGTSTGTATDGKGHYTLQVKNLQDTLRFSYIGYQTKTVPIDGRTMVDVTLKSTVVSSGNQLVVVAYNTVKKSSLTGSVSSVSPVSIQKVPQVNVLQDVRGKVPGLLISSGAGTPNSVGQVRIRGIGSINAGSGPLYVVDGVPQTEHPSGLDPNDIASFSVLKDAAATAIYGSRAANGVIVITTKKGKSGKTNLDFNIEHGFSYRTMSKRIKPLNTNEMLELLKEGWVNAGKNPNDFESAAKAAGVDPSHNTNWIGLLTRVGQYSQYHLSASGGGESNQYYISGGFTRSTAPQRSVDYKRGNVMLSLNGQGSKRLTYSAKLFGYFDKSHSVPTGGSFESPIRAFYRYQPWLHAFNPDGSYNLGFEGGDNVVGVIRESSRPHTAFHTTAQGRVQYNILKGLSIETRESIKLGFDRNVTYYSPLVGHGLDHNGEIVAGDSHAKIWTSTNILRYKHTFNKVNTINAFAGYETQRNFSATLSGEGRNIIHGLKVLDATSVPHDLGGGNTAHAVAGEFINAEYNYNEQYFLSASFRRDGSSRFGFKKRYGNFWSVGAGWDLSKKLLRSVPFISNLKLRASYGKTGNQSGISNTAARGLYGSGHNYNEVNGSLLDRYADAFLTWEVNKPFDVGIDFSFLNDRLSGSVDYYDRITSDLLLNVPLPASTGLTSHTENFGSMKNTGLEVKLESKNILSRGDNGLAWNTDFNISTNKNRITHLPSPLSKGTFLQEMGTPYYNYHLIAYAGVDPQTGEALWYSSKDKSTTTTDINDAVRIVQGNAEPKFYGGFTNSFFYKNFELSFMLYFKWGGKAYDEWGHDTNSDGSKGFDALGKMSRYEYEHRWQKSGDHTDVPKIVFRGTQDSQAQSSRFLYDDSYIRLRNVKFSYSLPVGIANSLHISHATIYLRAKNLFTYVKDKALLFDPSTYIDGELDQYAPNYKTITMGLDIKF